MALRRYHTPQRGGGIYIQRGGALTRYYTPAVTQRGSGLQERLIKIAGPSIVQAAQNTLRDVQGGKSMQQATKSNLTQLRRNLKRKAPRMVAAAGRHAVTQQYKKARRRVKDIFSL